MSKSERIERMTDGEIFEHTEYAVRWSWERLGSIPAGVALGSADIAECELESGERVIVTWGRNLKYHEQKWFYENTHFKPISLGSLDGSAELIIPDDLAIQLIKMLPQKETK